MIQSTTVSLPDLYEEDETAWLEAVADLIQQGRYSEIDYPHLAEYLSDMAMRDRREVKSRVAALIAHVLKWTYQPDHRSRSWRATVIEQRQELNGLVGRGVLRNHAETVLAESYTQAVERAAAVTGVDAARISGGMPVHTRSAVVVGPSCGVIVATRSGQTH